MSLIRKFSGGRWAFLLVGLLLLGASPLYAPQLLAFPHKTETPIGTVWSVNKIDEAELTKLAEQTHKRLSTSPIASDNEQRDIFLTDGGWRWLWLANRSSGAFALTRPFTNDVVVGTVEASSLNAVNGEKLGGQRKLSGVLAHEFTHGTIRRRYGEINAILLPTWKVEGYCDHVVGESSLSAEDVAHLEAKGISHPALPYYHGRQRVAAILADNGGSVDDLFSSAH